MIQQKTNDRIANEMKDWKRKKQREKVLWTIHFITICDKCMQMRMRNFLINSRKIRTRDDEIADKLVPQSRKTPNWWIVTHFLSRIRCLMRWVDQTVSTVLLTTTRMLASQCRQLANHLRENIVVSESNCSTKPEDATKRASWLRLR